MICKCFHGFLHFCCERSPLTAFAEAELCVALSDIPQKCVRNHAASRGLACKPVHALSYPASQLFNIQGICLKMGYSQDKTSNAEQQIRPLEYGYPWLPHFQIVPICAAKKWQGLMAPEISGSYSKLVYLDSFCCRTDGEFVSSVGKSVLPTCRCVWHIMGFKCGMQQSPKTQKSNINFNRWIVFYLFEGCNTWVCSVLVMAYCILLQHHGTYYTYNI